MESAKSAALIPAITQPIRQLKERFTLQGEPLKISECMTKLGAQITSLSDGVECEFTDDDVNIDVVVFDKQNKTWAFGSYNAHEDQNYETRQVDEKFVLSYLLKEYYRKFGVSGQMPQVCVSLAARLVR